MNTTSESSSLTPTLFWKWGGGVLVTGFILSLAILLLSIWKATTLLLVFPAAILTALGIHYLVRRPFLHLCVVLAGSVSILGMKEGLQIYEVAYAIYYISFLSLWLISTTYMDKRSIITTSIDKAILILLCYSTLSFTIGFLFDANLLLAFKNWLPITFLGFYFPIKDAFRRFPHAWKGFVLTISFMMLFVLFRNFSMYLSELGAADSLWHIAHGRVRANERFLMCGTLFTISFLLYTQSFRIRLLLINGVIAVLACIAVAQTRAVWLSLILGLSIIMVLIDRPRKRRLLVLLSIVAFVMGGIALIGFGDLFLIILDGLFARFSTIGTAITQDISLLNRYAEWDAVWDKLQLNPIIGYGYGVRYHFFNIIYDFTEVKSHIHNLYLGVWYRHGLIGLSILLFILVKSLKIGMHTFFTSNNINYRALSLACVASLIAVMCSGLTEAIILNDNGVLIITLLLALIVGLSDNKT